MNHKVKLISSDKNWIEGIAVQQLEKTADLPGVVKAVGLPDIHPGKGVPVGAAFITRGIIYPHLIGNDVGCGIGLWQTGFKTRKFKRDKWVKKLSDLENPWEGDAKDWLLQHAVDPFPSSDASNALGTIGGGNHFAELQAVEKVLDENAFNALDLDKNRIMIAVHSGSRDIGNILFRRHAERFGAQGLYINDENSEEALSYLGQHDQAAGWAAASRDLIAHRMCEQLNGEYLPILDIFHNHIEGIQFEDQPAYIHRKGAAPSDRGAVLIPGTRGSYSYLVQPIGDQNENAGSLPHGAGRRWNRRTTKERLKSNYNVDSFYKTDLGGIVICEDKDLLYEEAPQAYKNIDLVIEDMTEAGHITVIATLKPLITYKKRHES